MNPETIVNEIGSGIRSDYVSSEPHALLLICEQALGQAGAGNEDAREDKKKRSD